MKKFIFILLLGLMISGKLSAQVLEAKVNRSDIPEGETFLLTVELKDGKTSNVPDFAVLEQDFTIYYSNECPYVEYEVTELSEYAKENNIKINFIKIDSLEKAKNAPCIFNNWANFYKGEFISNTILNANSFKKLID